jgi:hypothetical protein
MKLDRREKREIAIAISCVLIVAVVGIVLNYSASREYENIIGAATGVAACPDNPTENGLMSCLKSQCSAVNVESQDCNTACGQKTCVPLEANCDEQYTGQCFCCTSVE